MSNKFLILFGLGFLALMIPSQAFAEFDVSLPPPLQVTDEGFSPITLPTDQGGIAIATGIDCKVKQTTEWFDQQGRIIDRTDSGGIQGSPFIGLEFTFGLMDDDIKHFQVIPKIFCSDNNGLPVDAWIKQMTITTVAQFEGSGTVVDTINISQSPLLQWGSGQGEQELANRVITTLDLEEHLPTRNLGVNWVFQITGTVNVAYSNFPQLVYQIPILWNELDTLVPTNVLKASEAEGGDPPVVDTDGDGFVDGADQCPTQAENFNGFQDDDGCPDTDPLTCPFGFVIDPTGNFCEQEPVDDPFPLDCEAGNLTTNDEITCMNECLRNDNNWVIDTNTGKGFCEMSDVIICIGLQCGEPDPEDELTTEDFLTGTVSGLGRIVFKDLSEETFLIGDAGFGFGAGNIQPLSVTVPREGEQKELERIEYEIHYRFPNTADGLATFLDDQDIIFTPIVEISSAQTVIGTPRLGQTTDLGDNAELRTDVGFSILLSKGVFLARDIQVIVTQDDPTTGGSAPIPEGQFRDVKFIIEAKGDFDFERESQIGKFTIIDSFASFEPIRIDNKVGTVQPVPCLGGQIPDFDIDGQQIGCKDPPPNDRDGDGVPDSQDLCPDDAGSPTLNGCPQTDRPDDDDDNDGINNDLDTDDDGDGIPDTEEDPEGCMNVVIGTEVICVLGEIIVGGDNGNACSLTTPQFCPTPTGGLDFNTLLLFGGVGLIIVAIIVVIARRR
jgi:hypothetical protein